MYRMLSYMQTITWLRRRNRDGFRVHLVPWLDCSIGWAWRIISGRQSVWSDAHSRRQGPIRRRLTGDRWQERDLPIGRDRKDGSSAGSAGGILWWDLWRGTGWNNISERHRWELPIGNYHGNSGNYHYPFFWVILHDFICKNYHENQSDRYPFFS